jgi:tetratricopeptide (TPR) repeat protein
MPRRPRTRSKTAPRRWPRGGRRLWILTGLAVLVALATVARLLMPESPARLRAEAEQAARDGDWSAALRAWGAFNATSAARAATLLAEARAALSLGRAAQAERSLRRAIAADPAAPDPVKVLLEILRVEDRTLDARQMAWESYEHLPAESRREVLGDLTTALLADMDDEVARSFLKRWIAADPSDVDARVALSQRIAAQPRADDPDRSVRLDELEAMVAEHPDHLGAREALVTALADAGEPDRGREVLDAWPGVESDRDARYWRLRGRWELEYDRHPDRAESAFRRVLEEFPQDWRSWAGLSRALTRLGRPDDARGAAAAVGRIREVLEPTTFTPRIYEDIHHLDEPRVLRDLADLADHAGLARLAAAWRAEAQALDEPAPPPAR